MKINIKSIKQELSYRAGSWTVWALVSLIARSLRKEVVNESEVMRRFESGLPSILSGWHGRTMIPSAYMGPRHWLSMVSLSRDGEYQARIFRRFGWQVVRGSSGRGGIRALATTVRKLKEGATLAFTPDGPKGPHHVVHPGVLFLSQKAGCPIFPVGVTSSPCWRLPTWDSYQIARPFGRFVMIYGDPITVPPDADEETLERLALELASRIEDLEIEAERRVNVRVR